ncbi:uncharacterized protein [Rutidosis leptorrhynchoides]|uniref:uncharacterized protein n=1 Tax=Rutidosis leptorrhynchoides TaxID=125765 RepID=UPI003A99B604
MASSSSSSSKQSRKQRDVSKQMETDEIVRYMSNLPSYLERGKPIQDRALSFGVMDWGRLEKWQYHHQKQGFGVNNKYSPSSSNSSLLSSTDGSSFRSSKSQISSHVTQKPHNVTLRSHLNISPEEVSSKESKVNRVTEKKTTDCSRPESRFVKKENFDSRDIHEPKSSDDMGSFQTTSSSSSSKGKMRIEDDCQYLCNSTSDKALLDAHKSVTKTVESRNLSPLRRLLNPIFSSKETSLELSHKDSKTKAKMKMDIRNCKDIKVDNSFRNSNSLTKQALFQIAIKNGRPLFTFAVDNNNNDILAATVRSLAGKDDANCWIYTFFTVHEVKKKKGGWLSHGTKGANNGYLPNVTAQMTVRNRLIEECAAREFVLSSVNPGQSDNQMLEEHLETELAAIVVRFLKKKADEDGIQDCFSTTVILPGGHHSVPRKGEPSPLIERWRSGGVCDCGGWDVGCKLRTLTNTVQSVSSGKFDLFIQGDVITERPFFSLSPLQDGIFSVEYNSSLSLLHAFSICISVIECRKSSDHTELKTYSVKQVDDDECPVTYASLAPLSSVERV